MSLKKLVEEVHLLIITTFEMAANKVAVETTTVSNKIMKKLLVELLASYPNDSRYFKKLLIIMKDSKKISYLKD